jgi:hypothetical protein
MELWEKITQEYPELAENDFAVFGNGTIILRDDTEGLGAYIAKWEYTKPIPNGMKVGKN